MKPYHKIPTVFKRNPKTDYRTLLLGEYATPELGYLRDCEWIFTEKVDGTNIRILSDSAGNVKFRGRTDCANISARLVNRLCKLFPPREMLYIHFPDGVCLYGEGFGAGIQKGGGNYQDTQEFMLFDIKIGDWWLKRETVVKVAEELGIKVAPVIGRGTLIFMRHLVQGKFESHWNNFQAEGLVARPIVELLGRNGERVICKLKCKDFV